MSIEYIATGSGDASIIHAQQILMKLDPNKYFVNKYLFLRLQRMKGKMSIPEPKCKSKNWLMIYRFDCLIPKYNLIKYRVRKNFIFQKQVHCPVNKIKKYCIVNK